MSLRACALFYMQLFLGVMGLDAALLSFQEITLDDNLYAASVACRNAGLREPLGRRLTPEELAKDVDLRHFVVLDGENTVVGTVLLQEMSAHVARARQVSVREAARGQGVGRFMFTCFEELCRSLGYKEVILHAREEAVPFYEKIGYMLEGEYFNEIGLPHVRMCKKL